MNFINNFNIKLGNEFRVVNVKVWQYRDSTLEKIATETGQTTGIFPSDHPLPGIYVNINGFPENQYFDNLELILPNFIEEFTTNEHRVSSKKDYRKYLINAISEYQKLDKKIVENLKGRGELIDACYESKIAQITKNISAESSQEGEEICSHVFYKQKAFLGKILKELKKKLNSIEEIIEAEEQEIHNKFPHLKWGSTDTALLELVTALHESQSIQSSQKGKKLTRKEALGVFEVIFNKEISDPESKLSRATKRKDNLTPFLDSLRGVFEEYALEKQDAFLAKTLKRFPTKQEYDK